MIIRAEWPGYVVDVLVTPGQEVEEDETLMLLEGTDATHTPFYVSAPESGKVQHVLLEEGAKIACGRVFALAGAIVMDRNYVSSECGSPETDTVGAGSNRGWYVTPAEPAASGVSPKPDTFWLLTAGLAMWIAVRRYKQQRPR